MQPVRTRKNRRKTEPLRTLAPAGRANIATRAANRQSTGVMFQVVQGTIRYGFTSYVDDDFPLPRSLSHRKSSSVGRAKNKKYDRGS